jgi:hypothetical protein
MEIALTYTMQKEETHHRLRWLVAAMIWVASCGSQPEAQPTPFVPQVTIVAPTQDAPTAEPQVVNTEPAPQATESSANSANPVTNAPAELPAGVNPYTGMPIGASALSRKPILFKVANTAEVRPQTGLQAADIVVEHLSEGGITRFTALYLTNAPTKIGSARSCRLIDIELPVMFDSALVCSGTSPGVKPKMRDSYAHQNNLTMISDFGPYECSACPMFRTTDRAAPHNLWGHAPNAWKELDKRSKNQASIFKAWVFSNNAAPNGKPTSAIDVPYKSGVVSWQYDAASSAWLRSLNKQKQIDVATGKTLAFANVVVVYAHHQITDIQEDVTGSKSIQIQVWGEGPVRVFRDGREYGGKWKRGANVGQFEFFDPAGNKIPLKPGNTWIEMAPLVDFNVTTK